MAFLAIPDRSPDNIRLVERVSVCRNCQKISQTQAPFYPISRAGRSEPLGDERFKKYASIHR
jgi:sigma54-dependent transcription regulator